ncbi:MAG TPA: hypothetical protein VK463_13180 [Desulfomonilaceae bacterium]|nr:hypothetical protein [Desulfomonilaceae bacterium]
MNKILMICLCAAFFCGFAVPHANAADVTSFDAKIQQIRESIEAQVERIKRARENTDAQMSLARIRLADQLSRSQEDLHVQTATLERLREQLTDQVSQANGAMTTYQSSWKDTAAKALADIEAQLSQTNAAIAKMEAARKTLESTETSNGQGCTGAAGITSNCASASQPATSDSGLFSSPDITFLTPVQQPDSPAATPPVSGTSAPATQPSLPVMPNPG